MTEFASPVSPDQVAAFAAAIDAKLQDLNDDYRAHRADGFGLKAPAIRAVPQGTFAAWMKSRGKLGGQNKVPRVINDRDLWANLKGSSAHSAMTGMAALRPLRRLPVAVLSSPPPGGRRRASGACCSCPLSPPIDYAPGR